MSRIGKVDTIVVHHSASPRSTTYQQIDRWHRNKGWNGCGYHFVIQEDGSLKHGRGLETRGAHCPPNQGRIGICVTGDNTDPQQSWNELQWASLRELVRALLVVYLEAEVKLHHEMKPTDCPGMTRAQFWVMFGGIYQ